MNSPFEDSNKENSDAWDSALFSIPKQSGPLIKVPPKAPPVLTPTSSEVSNLKTTFAPDTGNVAPASATVSQLTTGSVVPHVSELPVMRASLIPSDYQEKLPTPLSSHALVPLAGVLLATGLLAGGQLLLPYVEALKSQVAPENFAADKLYSVVSVPAGFLASKALEVGERLGNSTISVLAVATIFPEKVVQNVGEAMSQTGDDILQRPRELGSDIVAVVSEELTSPVVPVSNEEAMSPLVPAQVATVGAVSGLGNVLLSAGQVVSDIFQTIWEAISYYASTIWANWKQFLNGDEPTHLVNEEALRAQIKAEVLAELRADLAGALENGVTEPVIMETSAGQGVVVVPASPGQDNEAIAEQIKNLFSDEVLVDFDTTGQSGIITPVFKNVTGENYIFVLTPVRS